MAKLSDLPGEHRAVGERFPHLARLTPAEAALRAARIHHLENHCPLSGDLREITLAQTRRLAEAIPVHEFVAQLRHLHQMADSMPGTGIESPRFDFLAAADALRAANSYPSGFVRAVDQWLLGKHDPALYPDCDISAVVGAMEET